MSRTDVDLLHQTSTLAIPASSAIFTKVATNALPEPDSIYECKIQLIPILTNSNDLALYILVFLRTGSREDAVGGKGLCGESSLRRALHPDFEGHCLPL